MLFRRIRSVLMPAFLGLTAACAQEGDAVLRQFDLPPTGNGALESGTYQVSGTDSKSDGCEIDPEEIDG